MSDGNDYFGVFQAAIEALPQSEIEPALKFGVRIGTISAKEALRFHEIFGILCPRRQD